MVYIYVKFEVSVFKSVFEQIGKNLTLKAVEHGVPVVSGIFGALFDTVQMNTVLEYADVFYNKRFILEKEKKIQMLLESTSGVIDIE